jgi:hypothetical protein
MAVRPSFSGGDQDLKAFGGLPQRADVLDGTAGQA